MECPRRWAVLAFFIYIFAITDISCQNLPYEGTAQIQSKDTKRDISRVATPSFTYTPETPFFSNIQDDRSKTFNFKSSQATFSQEPTSFNSLAANIPNMAAPSTPASSFLSQFTRTSQPPGLSEPTSFNSITNYQNTNQPVQQTWQNDVYNYPANNAAMFGEMVSAPVIAQMGSPSDFPYDTNFGIKFQEPIMPSNADDEAYPVNLLINIPSQNTPSPRITLVSGAPQPETPVNSQYGYNFPPFGYLPPFPYVQRKSKSSLRKILPILLSILLEDISSENRGCCSCNCNCDCNSDSPIPIPYPIPIPTNNPIINTSGSSSSSRKRGQRDYDDSDDYDN